MQILDQRETLTNREREPFPLSALNQFLYCARRAALIHIEGVFIHNHHTLQGTLNHEHADLPGYEHRAGWKLLRALPIWSESLGLSGKADLVEVKEERGEIVAARPVEYKKGKVSRWSNDRVQLCAQALCLEEMLGLSLSEGMIFHCQSQKRTTVEFNESLRNLTIETVGKVRALLLSKQIPPAELKPQCEGCSLHEICSPEFGTPVYERMRQQLFKTK